jgi:hypothetical protein
VYWEGFATYLSLPRAASAAELERAVKSLPADTKARSLGQAMPLMLLAPIGWGVEWSGQRFEGGAGSPEAVETIQVPAESLFDLDRDFAVKPAYRAHGGIDGKRLAQDFASERFRGVAKGTDRVSTILPAGNVRMPIHLRQTLWQRARAAVRPHTRAPR